MSLRQFAFLISIFPAAAWADLAGTATIPAGSALNLDTGVVSSSADLSYSGTKFVAVGKAIAFDSGNVGLNGFNFDTVEIVKASALAMSNQPFTAVMGDVIFAQSGGGNFSKILITAINGASATVQYLTYGATSGPPPPSVTGVQNNYSYLLQGMPNYGIAPGSIFIVKGINLASATTAILQSSGGSGLPTTLNGATVTVTINGGTFHPGLYYAIATQLAAVLPSSTPVGTGTITVNYNGANSAAEPIQVVATALGFDSYFGTGSGLGVATDPATGTPYFFDNSAKPGQSIVLWGSGLGADTADSDTLYTTSPHAVNTPLQIYIGGIQATIQYQGSSGYPGLNQINVQIPSSVVTGCGVSIVAVSGSIVSNTVSIPVTPGGGSCDDPVIDGSGTPPNKSSYKDATIGILLATGSGQTSPSASANFVTISGQTGIYVTNANGLYTLGDCVVNQSIIGAPTGPVTQTGLDAGTVSITGPTGTQPMPAVSTLPGSYGAQLPSGFIPAAGGSFVVSGTGGKDIGPFSTTINYSNPLVWTNMSSVSSVTRSQGVNLTWTGGDPNGFILITGTVTSSASISAGYNCYAPVSAGQFTVPSFVLLGIPAGKGTISLEHATTPALISIPGADYALSGATAYFSTSVTYN